MPSIAANRNIEPARLTRLVQGELDWVALKALEKDRARRYETANALARDVQRYLADEVVEARPPSAGYRLRKFVRRHKIQVIAASLVLLALLAGIIGTTFGLFRAEQQRQIAQQRGDAEARAKLDAEAKRIEAEKQQRRAEAGRSWPANGSSRLKPRRKGLKRRSVKRKPNSGLPCLTKRMDCATAIAEAKDSGVLPRFSKRSSFLYQEIDPAMNCVTPPLQPYACPISVTAPHGTPKQVRWNRLSLLSKRVCERKG